MNGSMKKSKILLNKNPRKQWGGGYNPRKSINKKQNRSNSRGDNKQMKVEISKRKKNEEDMILALLNEDNEG